MECGKMTQKMSNFEDIFSNGNDHLERLESISYEDFFKDYLVQNRLCIFSSELTRKWRSRMEWVKDGKPNFEFLQKMFGEATVPVANCSKRYFSSQSKKDMKMSEFIDYLRNRQMADERCLYLKDWHFCKVFPEYNAYDVPIYFKSDWLNEYWDQCSDVSDDYRFVYFGPKGSWTPFHADVFRSYSWSANICGCKKWIIYPPGQEDCLCDTLGNLIYDVTSDEATDQHKYPKIKQCQKPIIVIQKEGEVIYVPSGWHHQVHNLEDTISINHNWTNACGLIKMWKHLQHELKKVQQSIQDCRDMDNWHNHCQLMLNAMTGMDYKSFVDFLSVIAKPRLEFLQKPDDFLPQQKQSKAVFMEWLNAVKDVGQSQEYDVMKYCEYDINMIRNCANMVKSDATFKELNDTSLTLKLVELISQMSHGEGS